MLAGLHPPPHLARDYLEVEASQSFVSPCSFPHFLRSTQNTESDDVLSGLGLPSI